MPLIAALALILALLLGPAVPSNAARNLEARTPARHELLVIEVAGCTVCDLVRIHIQPAYETSPHARNVPMRYVDITSVDELGLGLQTRVDTVPTIVLMRDGREVDRISGYPGPKSLFLALSEMLTSAID